MSLWSAGLFGGAIPDSEVDQFEYGGPVSDKYSGATGSFSINNNSPVFEGTYSIKSSSLANEAIMSYSGDGLPNYPQRGDWVQGFVQPQSSGSRGGVIVYSESGSSSGSVQGYEFNANVSSGEFQINDEAGYTNLANGGTPTAGQKYKLNIYSNSDTIQGEWIDPSDGSVVQQLEVTSQTLYSGEGFGFRKRDDSVWDDYRVFKNHGLGF
jgi:hypothetical protein